MSSPVISPLLDRVMLKVLGMVEDVKDPKEVVAKVQENMDETIRAAGEAIHVTFEEERLVRIEIFEIVQDGLTSESVVEPEGAVVEAFQHLVDDQRRAALALVREQLR